MLKNLILLLLCIGTANAAWIQTQKNADCQGTKTCTVTLTNEGAGHLLIMSIHVRGKYAVTSIGNNHGDTWHLARASSNSQTSIEVWYAENAVGGLGTDNISATVGTSADYIFAQVSEYDFIIPSGSLDKTAATTGSGQTATSGNTATTTQANELVVSSTDWFNCTPDAGNPTALGGATYRAVGDSCNVVEGIIFEDKFVGSTGVQSMSALGASAGDTDWAIVVATFKSAAATAVKRKPRGQQ